ncbi:hypothetical protein PVAP13_6KG140606 [Panicum virgatum]|uniref:Uncharacterized protein n=1 Tax=Panicum virgatum TaxID=38727 RepID=A0A8T0RBR1_PANVG|nr:hypothetical protein PVAP13_6KG140606 [Panicum virgatum]
MFFPVDRESLTEATSGAIGALVSTIVLYPLDTCRTKLQTHQGMHKYRHYSSGDRRKNLSVNTNEVVPFGAAMQVSS